MDKQALDKPVGLVVKHINNTLTPEEKIELDKFLQQPGTDLNLWLRLLNEHNSPDSSLKDEYDTNKAKEEFFKRIKDLKQNNSRKDNDKTKLI
ncbi:hypothetical protein A4H97_10970 [Niastella yeongjuensis]|uniref:Uncharacterized protein n=1 Tax=Niastella yeongjuensis TaxID=354355 RepID=A0A1V9EFN9_9BACT|nr:hypothetical protein [Niastella yeongjuensis]OQP44871.1 hypothetical protein A4H97_10970 [Niastella yeongjuensis]SEP41739.1 hypothetical protein SAMN05660816_05904 [Niastella yeongjuensis]